MNALRTSNKLTCNFGNMKNKICFLTASSFPKLEGVIAKPLHKTCKISVGETEFLSPQPLQNFKNLC